jgi:hypothetical protein
MEDSKKDVSAHNRNSVDPSSFERKSRSASRNKSAGERDRNSKSQESGTSEGNSKQGSGGRFEEDGGRRARSKGSKFVGVGEYGVKSQQQHQQEAKSPADSAWVHDKFDPNPAPPERHGRRKSWQALKEVGTDCFGCFVIICFVELTRSLSFFMFGF